MHTELWRDAGSVVTLERVFDFGPCLHHLLETSQSISQTGSLGGASSLPLAGAPQGGNRTLLLQDRGC